MNPGGILYKILSIFLKKLPAPYPMEFSIANSHLRMPLLMSSLSCLKMKSVFLYVDIFIWQSTLGLESVDTPLVVIQTRTETKQSSSFLDKFFRGVKTFKPKCRNGDKRKPSKI